MRVPKVVAALGVGFMLSASALHAQGVEFSLGGGLGVPLGNTGDVNKLGWHGLAALSFVPNGWPVGIQVDGQYHQFKIEDAFQPAGADLKNRLIFGTADLVYKFKSSETSPVRPYLIGGGGVYNLKTTGADNLSGLVGGGTTKFGVNAGAGFDFKAGSVGLFIEGRFHDVFTDGEDFKFIPITLGVRFGGH